jgi:hypothetical protein
MHIPAVVGMFAHTSRYVVRQETVAKWLVDDVSKTANASALAMLYTFTRRIMPPNSKENPKDVFERILCEVTKVTNAKKARKGRKESNQESDRLRKVADLKESHGEL